MKIFREEYFGGILYDTSTLTYKIIKDGKDDIRADRFIPLSFMPERTDIVSVPVRVYFELTETCNLSCRHCFVSSSPQSKKGMPSSVIFSLLEDMRDAGVINIRFTGGEPTTRDDWFDILNHAKSLGLVVSLSSNGVYKDPDKTISQIASLGLEQVTFSIDGLETNHDYLRGHGSFKSLINTLEKLKETDVNSRLTTVLTKLSIRELPEIVELASKYVKVINFVFLRVLGRGKEELSISFQEHYESGLEAERLQQYYPDLLILHSAVVLPGQFVKPGSSSGINFSSSFSNTSLNIAADGTYWPHHYASHQTDLFKLGKYPEDNIKGVWQSSEVLDKYRAWTGCLQERCFSCREFRHRCAGFNFEMEVARLTGKIKENYCCINDTPLRTPWAQ
ncbi:MAG: radical SAM protein [Candidatus Eremiobacterota bacterium]